MECVLYIYIYELHIWTVMDSIYYILDCIYGLYIWTIYVVYVVYMDYMDMISAEMRTTSQALRKKPLVYSVWAPEVLTAGCNKTTGPDQSRTPKKCRFVPGQLQCFAASLSVISLIHSDDNGMPSFLRAPGDIIQTRLRLCPAQLAGCPVARPGPMRHGGNGKSP